MKSLFSFPNPVNDVSARLVATGVVIMTVGSIVLYQFDATAAWTKWLVVVIAYGFLARVLTGPTLSPLGQVVTRVATPTLTKLFHLPFIAQPGPAKRFAQGIGSVLSLGALVSIFAFDNYLVGLILIGFITVAASLEAFLGYCLGCKIFAVLMRVGIVPETVCEDCNNIWARQARLKAEAAAVGAAKI